MKEVNLISLTQAFKGLNSPLLGGYCRQFKIVPKESELEDLESFIQELKKYSSDIQVFDRYFIGYTIPQISKEFDLLRFGSNSIVNIELKSQSTGPKILKQLLRNQYYLGFLKKTVLCYTYVSNENQLYSLDKRNRIYKVSFKKLYKTLTSQDTIWISDINKLFNPSNYLVSPFNSTDEFVAGEYFLTSHQEEIKLECAKKIEQKGPTFISICGKAGTGKSLLTFDIAKEYMGNQHKVLIVHCGLLNEGHDKLKQLHGWDIISIKHLNVSDLSNYFLLVIDECQRVFPRQLKSIISEIKANKGNCIFSYDRHQCLRDWEIDNDIPQEILDKTSPILFELTEKIRTNKEIASFITALFDRSQNVEKLTRDNIEISFFLTAPDAKEHISLLGKYGWKIINHTPSNRDNHPYDEYAISNETNAHGVIGQEFDKVIAVLDHCYYYKGDNLAIRNYKNSPFYQPTKMLFQIMTRTRLKLHVVIINNEEMMERCLSILDTN